MEKGLGELETGIVCMDNFSARGRHRTEEQDPALEAAIRALVDPQSQTDPKFQSTFLYTRVTGEKVRQLLIDRGGLPGRETLPSSHVSAPFEPPKLPFAACSKDQAAQEDPRDGGDL